MQTMIKNFMLHCMLELRCCSWFYSFLFPMKSTAIYAESLTYCFGTKINNRSLLNIVFFTNINILLTYLLMRFNNIFDFVVERVFSCRAASRRSYICFFLIVFASSLTFLFSVIILLFLFSILLSDRFFLLLGKR